MRDIVRHAAKPSMFAGRRKLAILVSCILLKQARLVNNSIVIGARSRYFAIGQILRLNAPPGPLPRTSAPARAGGDVFDFLEFAGNSG